MHAVPRLYLVLAPPIVIVNAHAVILFNNSNSLMVKKFPFPLSLKEEEQAVPECQCMHGSRLGSGCRVLHCCKSASCMM